MIWKNIFYGPVLSRRLGYSLGVNLLPVNRKICNFNCIYCECGLNDNNSIKSPLPSLDEFNISLSETLTDFKSKNQRIDNITFSGNGEPTLHPDFDKIIELTIQKRNEIYPETKIAVLTNSTTINTEKTIRALKLIDLPICKLDAGTEHTFRLIDQPESKITLDEITNRLSQFNGNLYIQTIFLKGEVNSNVIDNSTPEEVSQWLKRLKIIHPKLVMLYSLDRTPPFNTLKRVEEKVLSFLSEEVKKLGLNVEYYF
jgi:wyosine [tRNA(Phe)-imidazoG37] synthetase (radical SAM superfamily)